MGKRAKKARGRFPILECHACGVMYYKTHRCLAADRQCRHCDKIGHFSGSCRQWHDHQQVNKDQRNVTPHAKTSDFPHEKLACPHEPINVEEFCEAMDRDVSCEIANDEASPQEQITEPSHANDTMPCNLTKRKVDMTEPLQRTKRQRRNTGHSDKDIKYYKDRVESLKEENRVLKTKNDDQKKINKRLGDENEALLKKNSDVKHGNNTLRIANRVLRRQIEDEKNTNTALTEDNKALLKRTEDEKNTNTLLREENEVLRKQIENKPTTNKPQIEEFEASKKHCDCEKNTNTCVRIKTEVMCDDFQTATARNVKLETRDAEEKGLVERNQALTQDLDQLRDELDQTKAANVAGKDTILELKSQLQKLFKYSQKLQTHASRATTTVHHLKLQHIYVMDHINKGRRPSSNLPPLFTYRCEGCGSAQRHGEVECVAMGYACCQCGMFGHFTSVCTNSPSLSFRTTPAERTLVAAIGAPMTMHGLLCALRY